MIVMVPDKANVYCDMLKMNRMWLDNVLFVMNRRETYLVTNKYFFRCCGFVTAVIKHNMVEFPFNTHQGKIFPHLTFIVNDLSVQFHSLKIFLSLMFQATAPQRNLK
jgi:hypothetical protein